MLILHQLIDEKPWIAYYLFSLEKIEGRYSTKLEEDLHEPPVDLERTNELI